MSLRMELFVLAAGTFFLLLLAVTASALHRLRRRSSETWDAIIARLQAVDQPGMLRIVFDLEHDPEEVGHVELSSSDVWELAGGLDGLQRVRNNCDVLIDLAAYVQRSYPEAVGVAEELRLSAREIQWHVSRLEAAQKTGNLETVFPPYVQQAVAVYCRMTNTLLELYEQAGQYEADSLRVALQG